jgi:hypothetical protein
MKPKTESIKIQSQISMSLKSFGMIVTEFNDSKVLGHLKGVYKDKNYIFFITNALSRSEIGLENFKQSVQWCESNNCNYVVIAKKWDSSLDKFVENEEYIWRIMPMNKVAKIGQQYMSSLMKK